MLSGHTLTKTVRQWGLVIAMGVAGFAAGIAVFILIGRDGIVHALNAAPAIVVGLGLSVLLSLAFLAIGALVAVAQERWRNLLARIALNNMTQGLCMFDGAGRLVLCNMRYIEMHRLRRENCGAACRCANFCAVAREKGTFSGDPDRYVAECLKQVADGRTEEKTIKFGDGRIIALVFRPLLRRRLGNDAYRRDATSSQPRRSGIRCGYARSAASPSMPQIAAFRSRVENVLRPSDKARRR